MDYEAMKICSNKYHQLWNPNHLVTIKNTSCYWHILAVRGTWHTWQPEIIFLLIRKHKCFLPVRGDLVVVCNWKDVRYSVAFNSIKLVVIDLAWTLYFFWGVTHEWMSSVSEVLFLFWLAKMSSLSSWDEMDVRVQLLAYYVWAAGDDKTGFLSVEVDIFDRLYLKEQPTSFPMVQIITIKQKYDKCG